MGLGRLQRPLSLPHCLMLPLFLHPLLLHPLLLDSLLLNPLLLHPLLLHPLLLHPLLLHLLFLHPLLPLLLLSLLLLPPQVLWHLASNFEQVTGDANSTFHSNFIGDTPHLPRLVVTLAQQTKRPFSLQGESRLSSTKVALAVLTSHGIY